MPIDEQIIRLALDLGASPEEAAKLSAALDRINASGAKAASEGLDSLEKSAHKATSSMAGIGPAALQGGRALQDFSQGGIGGILNNIEGLAFALGGGPGLAGLLTAVGLAAYFAVPAIKQFAASLSDAGSNAIPKTGDTLRDLSDELEQVNKRIDKYKDAQSLTNAEVATYNELLARQVDLEARKADEQERQARLKRALTSVDDEQAQRASTFGKAVAGRGQETLDAIQQAMDREARYRIQAEEAKAQRDIAKIGAGAGSTEEKLAATQRRIDELDAFRRTEGGSNTQNAQRLFDALLQGTPGSRDQLNRLMTGGFGANFGGLAQRLQENDPKYQEWIKAADDEIEAMEKSAEKAQEKAAKEQEAIDKMQADIAVAGDKASEADKARLAKEIEDSLKAEDEMNARLERLWAKQDKAKADAAGDVIRQATGGSLGADLTREAAEMSVALQRQGLDANEATQQAIGAAPQAMQEMAMDASMQRRQAAMMVQQIEMLRRAQRAEVQAQHQPFQPRTR